MQFGCGSSCQWSLTFLIACGHAGFSVACGHTGQVTWNLEYGAGKGIIAKKTIPKIKSNDTAQHQIKWCQMKQHTWHALSVTFERLCWHSRFGRSSWPFVAMTFVDPLGVMHLWRRSHRWFCVFWTAQMTEFLILFGLCVGFWAISQGFQCQRFFLKLHEQVLWILLARLLSEVPCFKLLSWIFLRLSLLDIGYEVWLWRNVVRQVGVVPAMHKPPFQRSSLKSHLFFGHNLC